MQRADKGLAYMLQYENIAWYEEGTVRILDRRIYPGKVEFVVCKTHEEVVKAIADMVTQSAGPFSAAAMGMALAAHECQNKNEKAQRAYLLTAADRIANARPTTKSRMLQVTANCLKVAEEAFAAGKNVCDAIFSEAVAANDRRYTRMAKIAENLVDMFPDHGNIMTQCFAETIVGMMLKESKRRSKTFRVFCPETRPYFQGARLTATVVRDMGFDVTVITDNMPAYVMKEENIDVFTSAADAICMDGYVVNKIGTYQIAISAKYHGIPYFVTGAPDVGHSSVSTIHIEQRDPEFVLQAMGVRTATEGVKGYYPSFDITPPHLVSGVVTDLGIFAPYDLARYCKQGSAECRELVV
ncbi:MAG: S-methyl-5-thioribose-1-phosphate isomerase [Clostridia bacterium]|nr:S-methyl-5-thioribose-1-phosphate isomerase [Clostridia bacterium]